MSIPKYFDSSAAYDKYYAAWEEAGCFTADPEGPGEPYSIVIPPPNVTGSLHMGHALNNTLQDVLIRYKRMDGFNTVWVPGTDHAGIATQWIVEKQLRAEGLDRREMGREAFLERVWKWKAHSGGTIIHQLRRLGVSCDWSRERFTMDEGLSKAVREVFVRYYEDGIIYRAQRLINWDPFAQTALSNLEVENEEDFKTEIWSFAYPLTEPTMCEDGTLREEIVVATTRPETMLGDTAVAVHPEDPRYRALIGKTVKHPFVDREITIVADAELVDPEFGTGAVKITPAHDFNDFAVGQRHNLDMINILNVDGTLNAEGGPFEGMDRFDARKAVKEKLAALGLERGSKEHVMALPRSQRSGVPVEPMISTQWFVDMDKLAGPAIEAIETGKTNFVPKNWEKTYFSWMRNIQDWCISRQLWWGHRIPAWFCQDCGEISVSREDISACSHCGSTNVQQDEDVLDTWFSSALWAFSTFGWPEDTASLKKYYPTSVLMTGFDIIFFWVARMMFSGLYFQDDVPFKDIYIHALVRDEHGQKMSKTKGNVVDPLTEIDKIGVDAFRFTLVALAAQGRDILWNDKRAEGYVKFQNKVWQAFKFISMHLEDYDADAPKELGVYDKWILARLHSAVSSIRQALDEYRFNDVSSELYAFVWHEFCDWYLELSKGTLYNSTNQPAQQAAKHTLLTVFNAIVRLMHPIMPFLSEELWQRMPGTEGFVMMATYPKPEEFPSNPESLTQVKFLQEVIVEVRRIRAEMEIGNKTELTLRSVEAAKLHGQEQGLKDLCSVTSIQTGEKSGVSSTFVVDGVTFYIPLEGVIDIESEITRLTKKIEQVEKSIGRLNGRLSNKKYVDNAPAKIVQETRDALASEKDTHAKLLKARAELEG